MILNKSIPDYMLALATDFEDLEALFVDRYFEFIDVYWLLKDFSDEIESLEYDDNSNKKGLKIKVKVKKSKTKDVVDKLISEANECADSGSIDITGDRKVIKIHIKDLGKEPITETNEEVSTLD